MISINPKKPVQLSKFFNSSEFACNCGCSSSSISQELVDKLERVRRKYGHSLIILSAFRCSEYQKRLKARGYETAVGVSQHELGNAVDIRPASEGDFAQLLPFLEAEFQAIGVAKTFYHVDLRADKPRRWSYTKR